MTFQPEEFRIVRDATVVVDECRFAMAYLQHVVRDALCAHGVGHHITRVTYGWPAGCVHVHGLMRVDASRIHCLRMSMAFIACRFDANGRVHVLQRHANQTTPALFPKRSNKNVHLRLFTT